MRLIDADKIDFGEVFKGASDFAKDIRESAQSLIDAQPTVNIWISCSARLPSMEECQKNDNRFIVTDGNRTYQGYFDYELNCFVKMAKEDAFINCEDKCVIAWMPMPEPVKM